MDEKKLLISTRPLPAEAESHLQKLRVRELTDRLDRASVTGRQAEAKPLEIKNQSLLDVVKQVGREFDLPMALDAQVMHVNALDVNAKTSGCIVPGDLRNSLTKMLHPLGLTIEVRQEVVCVTPLRLFEHARKWLGPSVATVVLVASVSAWLLIRTRRPSAKS